MDAHQSPSGFGNLCHHQSVNTCTLELGPLGNESLQQSLSLSHTELVAMGRAQALIQTSLA